jgi:hypothetical protein
VQLALLLSVVTVFVFISFEKLNKIGVVTSTLVSPSLGEIDLTMGLILPSTVSSLLE